MKKVYLLSLFIFSCFYCIAQTITSAQSGNWFTPSTWVGGVVPGINNDVIIDNGHTITFQSFLDDAKMKNLTVRPSGTISSLGTITTGEDLINYGIINLLFSNPLNINRDLYNY